MVAMPNTIGGILEKSVMLAVGSVYKLLILSISITALERSASTNQKTTKPANIISIVSHL